MLESLLASSFGIGVGVIVDIVVWYRLLSLLASLFDIGAGICIVIGVGIVVWYRRWLDSSLFGPLVLLLVKS